MEDRYDMLDFCDILVDILSQEQIDAILQKIKDGYEDDRCPICHCRSKLYDKSSGKPLKYGDDVSNSEWHELHEINCASTLLTELRDRNNRENATNAS